MSPKSIRLRVTGLIFASILIKAAGFAQTKKEDSIIKAYIEKYKNLAILEMKRTGFPASIKIAQGIIETRAGTSELVLKSKNHFGLKCKKNWTGEKVFHDDDEAGECFRKYPSDSISYIDQSDYVVNSPRYKPLFTRINPLDYKNWANGLKKAGYATNPKYVSMLITKIEDWGLQKYSLEALKQKGKINDKEYNNLLTAVTFKKSSIYDKIPTIGTSSLLAGTNNDTRVNASATPVHFTRINSTLTITSTIENEYETLLAFNDNISFADKNKKMTTGVSNIIFYNIPIIKINRRKVISVPKGTSLLAIALHYNIPYASLLTYNDFKPDANITLKEQYIFINPKKNKSSTQTFHIVKDNQTLYDIAQLYGVYIAKLREYNYLAPGMEPKTNSKIYLREMAPRRTDIY